MSQLIGLGAGGVVDVRSGTPPREVMRRNLLVEAVEIVDSSAIDVFTGSVDSKAIRAGTIMAKIATTGKLVAWRGADAVSVVAIGSIILNVGTGYIGRFAAGDAVKVGKNDPYSIFSGLDQTLGAIATMYITSGTFAVSNAQVVSAIAVGDTVWVEPATADGSGDPMGVLLDDVTLRLASGAVCEREARVARFGFLKTDQLLGLAGRAKTMLAGQGHATPPCLLVCD